MNKLQLPEPPSALRCAQHGTVVLAILLAALPAGGHAQDARGSTVPLWRTSSAPVFDSQRAPTHDNGTLLSVAGLTRLKDGTIVVADNGAFNLKFYAADGRLLRVVGREGAGPNEYRTPGVLGTCGGELIHVYDGALARITVLDQSGRLVSTWRIGTTKENLQPPMEVICGQGPTAVLLGWSPDLEGQITKPMPHRGQIQLNLRVMKSDGQTTQLGLIQGPDRQRWMTSDGPRPLGKMTYVAIGNDRLFVGTGDSSAIDVLSLSGKKLSSIRLPYRRIRIDDDYLRDFVDRVIELNPNRSPAELKRRYADIEFPEFFPTHGPIVVDSEGHLWVERYRLPGETASRWTIFDRRGVAIGAVDLPDRFRLLEAATEDVVGTWEDGDGVLHVRAYKLQR